MENFKILRDWLRTTAPASVEVLQAANWTETGTGGGCTAAETADGLPAGLYVLLTDGNLSAPTLGDVAASLEFGLYDDDGELLAFILAAPIAAVLGTPTDTVLHNGAAFYWAAC